MGIGHWDWGMGHENFAGRYQQHDRCLIILLSSLLASELFFTFLIFFSTFSFLVLLIGMDGTDVGCMAWVFLLY